MKRTRMLLSAIVIVCFCGVRAQELTHEACQIDSSAFQNTAKTLVLTIAANTGTLKETTFKILDQQIPLKLIVGRKTYVKITATTANTPCKFEGDGVKISFEVTGADDPITIKPGESVEVLNGEKALKIELAERNFVPINFEVLEGAGNKAKFVLKNNPATEMNLASKHDNWFVVPKSQFIAGATELDVTIEGNGKVIVTVPEGEKPIIATTKPTRLSCFTKKCSMDIENLKDNILLEVKILADPSTDKPKITVGATKTETITLQRGIVELIRVRKDEFGGALSCSLSSTLKNIETPAIISILNLENPDRLNIEDKEVIYRGKPVSGVYTMGGQDPGTTLKIELLNPLRSFIQFSIINPEAQKPIELTKSAILAQKQMKEFIFFKDQVNTDLKSEFSIKNKKDSRVTINFERVPLDIEEILPGSQGTMKGAVSLVLRRPPNKKDTTVILELLPQSPSSKTLLKIGEDKVEVGSIPLYYYLRQDDFNSSTEVLFRLEEKDAVVKYTRIDTIVPFHIISGLQTFSKDGQFSLKVEKPLSGVTLKVKPLQGKDLTTTDVVVDITLARKGADGEALSVSRKVDSATEAFIFIYPEDLNGATSLAGSLTLEKGESVEVTNNPGIEEITLKSGSLIVRKNTVRLSIPKPTEDHTLEIQLEKDSLAKSVTFEIAGEKHSLNASTKQLSIPLKKDFLKKNPSPAVKLTTDPDDLDAHVTLKIIPGIVEEPVKKCVPDCKGDRECVEEGGKWQCVCKLGFSGDNCEKNGSSSLKQSLVAVLMTTVLSYLFNHLP